MKRTLVCALLLACAPAMAKEHHYLYAASPGIRNYLEYGGMGIVVFDIDDGYKFVQAHPDVGRAGGRAGGGERQGHRGEREDAASCT